MAVYTVVKLIGTGVGSGPQPGNGFTTLATWESGAPGNLTTAEKSASTTFLVAAFVQGETLSFVGSGAAGKLLETDSTGAGNGSYVVYGITSGNPAAGDVVTGATSGATCVLSSSTADNVGIIWRGEINSASDNFSTGSSTAVTMSGDTTSSTCYKELTAKAGASFFDNASVQSNALRFNTANGCSITSSNATATVVVTSNHAKISRIQIETTAAQGGSLRCATMAGSETLDVNQCIIEHLRTTDGGTRIAGVSQYRNCLIVLRTASGNGVVFLLGNNTHIYNCTVVVPSDLAASVSGIDGNGAGNLVKNCAVFGATADIGSTFGTPPTCTTCYTDDASPSTGFTSAAYDTSTGSGFQNTADATRDYRIKSGSAMVDVGTTDSTNAAIDIAGTARPSGSAYDVGCWELVQGAAAVSSTRRRRGGFLSSYFR